MTTHRSRTAKKATTTTVDVEAIRHQDTRKNIPTEELRAFQPDEPGDERRQLTYARDTSLDPQLVWRGKDEQDRQDLAVPVVPIYIQEKIHPQAIIDSLIASQSKVESRERAGSELAERQLDLFASFDGPEEIDLGQKVEFYEHDQQWSNRMILGDSLLVMASLAEQEGLKGKVQTIYLDPPYGIKFGSNWQVSTRKRDVKDGAATDATRQPEQVKAFRDTWQLGIHSYLAYLRDRLVVAREMLAESGSVFVQIGDENVHRVRNLMDEVFGDANAVSMITFTKTGGQADDALANIADYLLWYAKDLENIKYRQIYQNKFLGGNGASKYNQVELADGKRTTAGTVTALQEDAIIGARYYRKDTLTSQRPPGSFPVQYNGSNYYPTPNYWKTHPEGMKKLILSNRVVTEGRRLAYVRYLDDFPAYQITNVWDDLGGIQSRSDPKVYVVQTNAEVCKRAILMTTDPGDLILDPTCGSGTTAYVAEQWGRRWITIDTSRVALALARTRLMGAKYPFYYLADTREGIEQEAKASGKTIEPYDTDGDIRKGFVYKRVPHVTLKSIANNPDIREGMTREEIDAAIAKHADTETLYDQPYEDRKRVRVSGPFTVESLSPHRVLSAADDDQDGTVTEREADRQGDFATMIRDYLVRTGVHNGTKGEDLRFDHLDPHAGEWVQYSGAYTERDGTVRTVAVSIGPEHGTVDSGWVGRAAREAVRTHDVLVVCGFAFDAGVGEEARKYGRLTILPTKMNPDLTMGDDLLKKTGSGNLFMVFGEPDVEISRQPDGQVVVRVRGVDVYDPTTGAIRSNTTDDIACWFIDTAYNEEAFFVRHAYFTGAQEPYERLKRALRAEVDEDAWASLYRTESRPFPPPLSGRIAVKVINHYGDEVMKVYTV